MAIKYATFDPTIYTGEVLIYGASPGQSSPVVLCIKLGYGGASTEEMTSRGKGDWKTLVHFPGGDARFNIQKYLSQSEKATIKNISSGTTRYGKITIPSISPLLPYLVTKTLAVVL